MLKPCVIALKLASELPDVNADYIGADRGALALAQNHIRMVLAIGDFDSVREDDMHVIELWADEIIRLNPIKDCSDSEAALAKAIDMGYETIYLAGASGGRLDHTYVNLQLMIRSPHHVVLIDDRNLAETFRKGSYEIAKGSYTYASFFALEDSVVSLKGMKYPMDHRLMSRDDVFGLSNEIPGDTGTLTVHQGRVLMIRSRD
jgi:thiamine pyrophosphokinase